jgi:hypothetical protein
MDEFVELSYDEWERIFKPIKNHIDPNASMDGYMFETYGDEVEFVKNQSPEHIWMYGDGDDGGTYIWNGWGFVNRLGYFITEEPCLPNTTIQVLVSHNWYYCENCGSETEDPDNLIRDAFQDVDLDKCPSCATPEELAQTGYKPAGV